MAQWLREQANRDHSPDEQPEPGEGRLARYSSKHAVGLVELESGERVLFTELVDGTAPEPGLPVYAGEFGWNDRFGWVATEVELVGPSPPEYPDLQDVRSRIDELTDLHPEIASLAKPSVFLRPTPNATSERTHFQGHPLVARYFEWPESPEGPMRFIAQLDFADLTRGLEGSFEEWPNEGLLALFADEEFWRNSEDESYWELVYLERPQDGSRLTPPDERLDRPAVGVDFETYPTLPSGIDREYRPKLGPDDPPELVVDIEDALYNFSDNWEPSPRHHVGGYADWIQWIPRERAHEQRGGAGEYDPDDWRLLWAVDSDPRAHGDVFWGDCGRLYLLIHRDDLADRRFERTQAFVQFH